MCRTERLIVRLPTVQSLAAGALALRLVVGGLSVLGLSILGLSILGLSILWLSILWLSVLLVVRRLIRHPSILYFQKVNDCIVKQRSKQTRV